MGQSGTVWGRMGQCATFWDSVGPSGIVLGRMGDWDGEVLEVFGNLFILLCLLG